ATPPATPVAPTPPATPVAPTPAASAAAAPAATAPASVPTTRAARKAATRQPRAATPQPTTPEVRTRRWRLPHVAWLAAAPVPAALVVAGVLAYRQLTTPPEATVPDGLVGTNLTAGEDAVTRAGLVAERVEVQSPQPAGVVLAVRPRSGRTLHEGDTVA